MICFVPFIFGYYHCGTTRRCVIVGRRSFGYVRDLYFGTVYRVYFRREGSFGREVTGGGRSFFRVLSVRVRPAYVFVEGVVSIDSMFCFSECEYGRVLFR